MAVKKTKSPPAFGHALFGRGGTIGTLYAFLTTIGGPLVELLLRKRLKRGREDADRLNERRGIAGLPRPKGPLVWIHAASIGEALSVMRLVERLLERYPALNILVTTGTVTSARLLGERLPERALHQYVPVDRLPWVRRFLDHWHPDTAFWVESELWPNLVLETQTRGIPMVLLNARMSVHSFARWRRLPGFIRPLMKGFSAVLAQDEIEAGRLIELGADPVLTPGNLKFAATLLPADTDALAALKDRINDRPCWVAASTHEGEEEIAAYVHNRLADDNKGLLTIIIPRHPARGVAIAAKLSRAGNTVALRSANQAITADTGIYIADTLGELGLFYRLSGIALVGGSLIPHGGQNLLEPARLDCAILHGPHMENFRAIVNEMAARGGAAEVADAEELVKAVRQLLANPKMRSEMAAAAADIASTKEAILDTVLNHLDTVLAGIAARARGDETAPQKNSLKNGSHAGP
jgi:3-deoxy-D-manno-octulosonic-acid transferase